MTKTIQAPCPECGGSVSRGLRSITVPFRGREVAVSRVLDKCDACGELLLAPGEMNEILRDASAQVRRAEGLLLPDEIVALRQRLGLTQEKLESLLGVGPKTVVRWERGTVFQSRAVDSLLRVIGAVPEAARYLSRARSVAISAATSPVETPPTSAIATYKAVPASPIRFNNARRRAAKNARSVSSCVPSESELSLDNVNWVAHGAQGLEGASQGSRLASDQISEIGNAA